MRRRYNEIVKRTSDRYDVIAREIRTPDEDNEIELNSIVEGMA